MTFLLERRETPSLFVFRGFPSAPTAPTLLCLRVEVFLRFPFVGNYFYVFIRLGNGVVEARRVGRVRISLRSFFRNEAKLL